MNYLVSTFDGLGDGVIYYPLFKNIAIQNPNNQFYCTGNIFFSDESISRKIDLPSNIKIVPEIFRKFSKDSWCDIKNFLKDKKINKVINLRFIGREFEKDYFAFKENIKNANSNISFFDSDDVINFKNNNVREVYIKILTKAFGPALEYDSKSLKDSFTISNTGRGILINMHSGGVFKLWNINKWAEVISLMVFYGKEVYVYIGHDQTEKAYTKEVVDRLNNVVSDKVKIFDLKSLHEMILCLDKIKIVISIDSGLIHLADALGIFSLGIYLTTSPIMWGGVSNKFKYVQSPHMHRCKNFYPQFGMCINKKKKCFDIENDKNDIDIQEIFNIINRVYEKES